MKRISIMFIFGLLLVTEIIENPDAKTISTEVAVPLAETQFSSTSPKPKLIMKDNELCKKCSCNMTHLQIDCSNKSMTSLFSDEEWQMLQNGDVFFETIKFDLNEISYIPALPTYPVKFLYLKSNQINNISIGAFQNLSQLTVLDLSDNKLLSKSLTPHVFMGKYATDKYEPLTNLISLNLASNELHNLNSGLFMHLPNLETLILSQNTFHLIDASTVIAIASLNLLKILDLSYMGLTNLPDTLLHSPVQLETLILTGNLFKIIPSELSRARNLKSLTLDENPLGDFYGTNIFKSLGELEYLSISNLPDVTAIGPWALSCLQNLTTLVAVDNPGLIHIHELAFTKNTSNPSIFDYPPLKKLHLHNNNLTTIERKWLLRWEKITDLDLSFNPWVCDCTNIWLIQSLMKQLNDTRPLQTNNVKCATPSAWKGRRLLELTENKKELLCLNINHPENYNLILVGILVGALMGIPLTFACLVMYRKGCFALLRRKNYIYNRASFADEFHI